MRQHYEQQYAILQQRRGGDASHKGCETAQPERPGQQLRERNHTTGTPAQRRHAHHLNHYPTGKTSADWALHIIDNKIIRGHADWFQRAFSYLLIGGFSVVVNLVVFSIMYYQVSWPHDQQWHYVVAFAVASEVSILANFFPNDAITFRRLPGHSRPWLVRCVRFHATYLLGTLLQLFTSFSLHLLGSPALFAQAAAIALVTAFNFAFHHIFTYRSVAHGRKTP
jgi:putative flippase GtrA